MFASKATVSIKKRIKFPRLIILNVDDSNYSAKFSRNDLQSLLKLIGGINFSIQFKYGRKFKLEM